VSKNFVRLAVGIENIDDIIADLELGFATLQQ
ncbi:MAG: PLP-dependent transferase, partial [Rothia dentocariosa]|jgi:O-acetylhomoserine sulfhydrylase|nr:PLP-dependent transferase [Rothia dentocariosa]